VGFEKRKYASYPKEEEDWGQHVLHLRLRYDKEFLYGATLCIKEVAAASEFNGSDYFARIFKEKTGISPLKFRMGAHSQDLTCSAL